jgi:hypothetical protein
MRRLSGARDSQRRFVERCHLHAEGVRSRTVSAQAPASRRGCRTTPGELAGSFLSVGSETAISSVTRRGSVATSSRTAALASTSGACSSFSEMALCDSVPGGPPPPMRTENSKRERARPSPWRWHFPRRGLLPRRPAIAKRGLEPSSHDAPAIHRPASGKSSRSDHPCGLPTPQCRGYMERGRPARASAKQQRRRANRARRPRPVLEAWMLGRDSHVQIEVEGRRKQSSLPQSTAQRSPRARPTVT